MQAARAGLPGASQSLQAIAANPEQPTIARATALAALAAYPDNAMLTQIQQGLAASEPLVRLGALQALDSLGAAQRRLAAPLLWDERKAIRIEAARLLASVPAEFLTTEVKDRLAEGIDEYIAVQTFNTERPEAQLNLGVLYADLGRDQAAEQAYRQAIARQSQFAPAYVNLAQWLSQRGQEQDAGRLLRQGLSRQPDSADLHHALGLSLVRQQRLDQALVALAKAADLAPENARYGYVYAVALQSGGKLGQAIAVLEDLNQRHPGDLDTLVALISFHREAGNRQRALHYAQALQRLRLSDPSRARVER